jgi:hypothetical protein
MFSVGWHAAMEHDKILAAYALKNDMPAIVA